jgi:uncharacterized protein (DUF433 family)
MAKPGWPSRISVDPQVCHGQPCIRGTRIMVSILVDCIANGDTEEELLAAYPMLRREDIRAALRFAAALTRERLIPAGVGK